MRPLLKTLVALAGLAALSGLGLVAEAPDATRGRAPAQVDRLGAGAWHRAGQRGQGALVAVLDTDFSGYKAELGRGLPGAVKARSFRKDGDLEARGTGHGLRSAMVVHAVAPRAGLLLANWDAGHFGSFLDAVRWARKEGARVITCSVTSPTWGDGEGGGPHHAELARALGRGDARGDVLFVGSAGNVGRGHWGGQYRRGAGGHHEWARGVIDNELTPHGDRHVRLTLIHKPGAVYELLVYEGENSAPKYRKKSDPNRPLPAPRLVFDAREGGTYRVRVRTVGGQPGEFHLVTRDSSLKERNLKGSVCSFPADNALVLAVGAVDEAGRRADYSPCGPAGGRLKPELVAPSPFALSSGPYGGTSASAPQVAGVAALLVGKAPAWTARRLRQELEKAAVRPGAKLSFETGYGRVALPAPRR